MGRVAVIHPDLGIGGAERLIVDACRALQDEGHKVIIYTGYHNPNRCFQETRDGTLKTIPVGQWIPRTILGRCHALMAYLKMIYIAFYLMIFSQHDLILCDQVSACIPFLRFFDLRNKARIVFYCHFPDQLLTQRDSLLKQIYRKPIDKFEEWSTSLADIILVNSKFTRDIVKKTFPSIRGRELEVLYPCVDVDYFIQNKPSPKSCLELIKRHENLTRGNFTFLSLNRFERKKGLEVAIYAIDQLKRLIELNKKSQPDKKNTKPMVHLIVAGGYDPRLQDCVAYRQELERISDPSDVTFIESPSDEDKLKLLQICDAVVYTPQNEHFGIVPLEAMAMSKPVVAHASGGPLETVEDRFNGYLCREADEWFFSKVMEQLYMDQEQSVRMGANGFERVKERFSYQTFRDQLNRTCFP